MQSSKYGHGLFQVTNLESWLRSPEEWANRVQNSEKMTATFKKLFGDESSNKKKKRKRERATTDNTDVEPHYSAPEDGHDDTAVQQEDDVVETEAGAGKRKEKTGKRSNALNS